MARSTAGAGGSRPPVKAAMPSLQRAHGGLVHRQSDRLGVRSERRRLGLRHPVSSASPAPSVSPPIESPEYSFSRA